MKCTSGHGGRSPVFTEAAATFSGIRIVLGVTARAEDGVSARRPEERD